MSDLISKRVLLARMCEENCGERRCVDFMDKCVWYHYIHEQPAIEQYGTWIPCSERLPEKWERVLVWFEYYRYGEFNRLYQSYGIGFRENDEWSRLVNGTSGWHELRIIAWMPLPEPYREEKKC